MKVRDYMGYVFSIVGTAICVIGFMITQAFSFYGLIGLAVVAVLLSIAVRHWVIWTYAVALVVGGVVGLLVVA
jgi:hypothetical protein